jgi:hypothetical protein
VAVEPVGSYAPAQEAQEVTGQEGDLNPGQDEEAGLIGDELQTSAALVIIPANPSVAGRTAPSGGTEEEHRQLTALGIQSAVVQMGTHRTIQASVVPTGELGFGPTLVLRAGGKWLQKYGAGQAQWDVDLRRIREDLLSDAGGDRPRAQAPQGDANGGKLEAAALLQLG